MGSRLGGPLEQAAAQAVREYVDALRSGRGASTPRTTIEATQRRLARIEHELLGAPPMRQLRLIQERRDLQERARALERERAFVEVARTYSRRHGIDYETWREMGVPVTVLRRAGLRPSSRP